MSWFDRQLCTLEEAQQKSAAVMPGFLQLGDAAKLWVEDLQAGQHKSLACFVVGVKATFGKLYYDVAVPLDGGQFCAVTHDVYGYVTPPHYTRLPENPQGVDLTGKLPELRRELMHPVRSEADHAAQAGADLKFQSPRWEDGSRTVISLPLTGRYFSKKPPSE